jgi:hypothetical protein
MTGTICICVSFTDALNWGYYIASVMDELVVVHEWDGKQKYSENNPVSLLLCPPQIPHRLV